MDSLTSDGQELTMKGDTHAVEVWNESILIPTYEPYAPLRQPMFLDKRVYQGSSGKVYPLPFIDRVSTTKSDRAWRTIFLENEYLQVMILPELGGRIHAILDKTKGYDAIYRQGVIKPALVGLAGPWISGGIEFNWPQHHRPSTFMPVDTSIESHADGSVTVWMSEHDPMCRMKGMHGVCLHPGKSFVELKVRLYNRTPMVQTFLWWANVAAKVHELYQSFFPPDVQGIADHAKRATSRYPLCDEKYYGVDYASRGRGGVPQGELPSRHVPRADRYAANDLSWYANIPVPTSYMCVGSRGDFFGGYDHAADAGIIHIASHHISPGKKQWTWGNHEFGYAWDRNLSDDEAPYIELMAGVYTDNQPDFSFLMPGETKSFNQYWYPIRQIGPADWANLDAACSIRVDHDRARIGIAVTSAMEIEVVLRTGSQTLWRQTAKLAPDQPLVQDELRVPPGVSRNELELELKQGARTLLKFAPGAIRPGPAPCAATEPPLPAEIASSDELYTTGLHLEQYRHATRSPEPYWREALRRDPLDSRCNNAVGRWHLRRGEFAQAEKHFRAVIARLTSRNPNPYDSEPFYNLGLTLRYTGREDEAYDALYKSTWTAAWRAPAFVALAELDCRAQRWESALDHLDRALAAERNHLNARDLMVMVLRKLDRDEEADALAGQTLQIDPLDFWARWLVDEPLNCDGQVKLDLAINLSRAGFFAEAMQMLHEMPVEPFSGAQSLAHYYRGYFAQALADAPGAAKHFAEAAAGSIDYCFPARLEEILILQAAMRVNPSDAHAPYLLGTLYYDRGRRADAIEMWEKAATINPHDALTWRNLGIAYFNHRRDFSAARDAYERAWDHGGGDARLLFERDQLSKRLGVAPEKRLAELEQYPQLVASRDDLSVELCGLLNLAGRHVEALRILNSRQFQPWEGGEGLALSQFVYTHLALGKIALKSEHPESARRHFAQALQSPPNLGETKHLLTNRSDVHYWLGVACGAVGDEAAEKGHLLIAAQARGDFQEMSVRQYSEMTYFSAMAMQRLDLGAEAERLFDELLAYGKTLATTELKIDYFATSLPAMLLFEDDLTSRRQISAMLLEAQAQIGFGEHEIAKDLLREILQRDPNHLLAGDLFREFSASMHPVSLSAPR
jgi:tetratricopeptide (TPR) repeat protein